MGIITDIVSLTVLILKEQTAFPLSNCINIVIYG